MPVKGTGGGEKGSLVLNLTVKFPEKLNAAQVKGLTDALGEPERVEKTPDHEECFLTKHVKKPKKQRRGQQQQGMRHMQEGEMPGGAQCAHQ